MTMPINFDRAGHYFFPSLFAMARTSLDLTHFLKLGDLIIKKDDATYEIVEVKKGHEFSGRITRRRQAMRSTVGFLNEGQREINGTRFVISDVDITPETAHTTLELYLREPRSK